MLNDLARAKRRLDGEKRLTSPVEPCSVLRFLLPGVPGSGWCLPELESNKSTSFLVYPNCRWQLNPVDCCSSDGSPTKHRLPQRFLPDGSPTKDIEDCLGTHRPRAYRVQIPNSCGFFVDMMVLIGMAQVLATLAYDIQASEEESPRGTFTRTQSRRTPAKWKDGP